MSNATCRTCWWQEGGRCYLEPCQRIPNPAGPGTVSTKGADNSCDQHTSKRSVLSSVIPTEMLVIQSEQNPQP